jgi:NhaA family Na+:H+ antiporter
MGTTVIALVMANLPLGTTLHHLWEESLCFDIGSRRLVMPIRHFVNEGLMALFFLLVGLELKRELLSGELSSLKEAALPIIAAAGGMVVPAALYHAVNPGGVAAHGWGIPMATDIAFAVGILVLLAWRIPRNLIIFLTALAIADDLGAVVVIALFYTQAINLTALGLALLCVIFLIILNRGGIRHILPYGIIGFFLWLALLKSGVHATMAGVILAFTIPARPFFAPEQFDDCLGEFQCALRHESNAPDMPDDPLSTQRMSAIAQNLEQAACNVQSPQQRMEYMLTPWVTFLVIPLFALVNAGVNFSEIRFADSLHQPVTIGVILGLVLGKFLGISGASFIAVKSGLARLPVGLKWRHIFGVAWLGGIGFTMSIFIGQLAFTGTPTLAENAKLGILLGSLISAIIGSVWLYLCAEKQS